MVPYGLTGSVLKRCAPRHSGVDIELTCEKATVLTPRVGSWELDLAWSHVMIPGVGRFFRRPWFGLGWRGAIRSVTERSATHRCLRLCQLGAAVRGRCAEHTGAAIKMIYNSSSLAGQIAAFESGCSSGTDTLHCA